MSDAQNRDPVHLAEAVGHAVTRLRVPLLALLALVAVVLIVTLVVTERRRALLESSTVLIEEVERRWLAVPVDERASIEDEVVPQLEMIARRHGSRYAGRRALQMLAGRHVDRQEWQEAADLFRELAGRSTGYLAALALSNAAVAHEELGDRDTAASLYGEVASRYPDEMALAPRALFAQARLEEERGDSAAANDAYAALEAAYPASRWSLLARNRLIYLRAAGALDGR